LSARRYLLERSRLLVVIIAAQGPQVYIQAESGIKLGREEVTDNAPIFRLCGMAPILSPGGMGPGSDTMVAGLQNQRIGATPGPVHQR
jgi:hypothetical protein